MKTLGNIIAVIGVILMIFTFIARFTGGEPGILGMIVPGGLSASGMYSGIACLMLVAVVLILNEE
ncbi:MAG: hypothetical protein GF408_03935 [Candidatus Omnitrophica bacterium]|nr:hypothetical protein [Candidatus Omnitrophota bacterium]